MKKENPNSFSALYKEAGLLKNIRRSLTFIIFSNIFGTMHGVICGSTTLSLVGLAHTMNATDLDLGLITAICQVAALSQIPFSMYVNKHHHRKKVQLIFGLICRVIWIFVGMIPFVLPMDAYRLQIYTLMIAITISGVSGSAIGVCWFPWFSDLCPGSIKSRFLAKRDVINNVTSLAFSLVVGLLLDYLPVDVKYLIIFIIGGVLGCLDILCFVFVDEVYSAPPKQSRFKDELGNMVKNKRFRNFVLTWAAWCFTVNLGDIFIGQYYLNYLGLSNLDVTIFSTIVCACATILSVMQWGKAINHFGSKNVMLVSCILGCANPLFLLFASKTSIVLSIIATVLRTVYGAWWWSGSNLACTYLQLTTTPDDTRPTYIAVYTVVCATVGNTLGSTLGGVFLDTCVANNWFTGYWDRYKILFIISVILRFALVWPAARSMEDDSDKKPKDLLRAIFRISK